MAKDNVLHPVSKQIDENIEYLKEALGVDKSFDIIHLDLEYAEVRMALFVVDGFAKDFSLTQIQRELIALKPEELLENPLKTLTHTKIPYVEIDTNEDLDAIVDDVLAGQAALVVDGLDKIILVDTRTYPVRGPEEPDTEQVIRGAKDGYVETLVENAALTRRRVRDRTLRIQYKRVGRRSKTDLCIAYIEDIADPEVVDKISESIDLIDTDGLPMGDKTIEEFIFGRHYNPYPMVRYSERPDVVASHLFEGHVVIMVDGSPSVMITPTTFWHHLQHAEEYRQKPIIGIALRGVRFAAVWASIFLLPLWYLFATNQHLLPEMLAYIGPNEEGQVPIYVQFLLAEVGIEMLRMAAIHTPSALATALGLVAAILIGEVAIEVGWFSPEVVLYLAVAAVGSFATPSYELSLANRLIRVFLLISTAIFGLAGYLVGIVFFILLLVNMRGFQTPYLWPFLPFSLKGFKDVLLRSPIPLKNRRPAAIHPLDPDR
ncbi:spore germination protein [Alkalihalobacterium chitinilyticum]|uniref:Spore germination protein n=1 Tax=Alkalihalobacterium chitinilyticum TaxID=2980103 RepID=A0ABT5VFL2_9BACI|nr:spore germination protein [Alkalihalobacterium chitinilyticum]MDE5413956.1 spore germination protein [Alkalihalobacterium chitinilyticum]